MQNMERTVVTAVNDELLVVRLSGTIDHQAVCALARDLNDIERNGPYPKRLVFVDENLTIAITSADVLSYKGQRREPRVRVRTAFCVFSDLQYGIARMFQALLQSEMHEIEIFRHRAAAAQWLDIDIDAVQ